MVRSEEAPRSTELPSTVEPSICALVSPVMTETATAAPAVLATLASAVVVALSLLLAMVVPAGVVSVAETLHGTVRGVGQISAILGQKPLVKWRGSAHAWLGA